MSIFKKIIICFIFLIPLIGNLAVPKRVIAADPTITFVRTTNTQDATTSKWLWEFRIDTSFVDDNTLGYATLYKNNILVKKTPFIIVKNVGHYTTTSILDPGTTYMVDFSIDVGKNLPIGKDFSEKTGGTAPPLDCTPKVFDPTSNTCIDPPANKTTKTTYTMLAPLPGLGLDGTDKTIDTAYDANNNPCPFGYYLNIMIKLFLGICGVLAVIMIIWGGVQYMTNELISNKEEGRKSITNAIFGLLLALGSYIILNTLNPDLLNICLNLPKEEITILPEQIVGDTPPTDGKICNDQFKKGDAWPPDSNPAEVDTAANLATNKISVNLPFCTQVGQTSHCTSVYKLDTAGIIKLKQNCDKYLKSSCEIIITGGTECWFHTSSAKVHMPGGDVVDLHDSPSLTKYITQDGANKPQMKQWIGGKMYPMYIIDGMHIVYEAESTHYHIISY